MTIRVLHVGLGPIGLAILKQVSVRSGFEVAGAVDIDPEKVGRDVAELLGADGPMGVVVEAELSDAVRNSEVDVAVLCTGSTLPSIMPQLETILGGGVPVVSTNEELSFPRFANPELADRLDALAREAGAAVVGTGVNPGYAMDTLPIALTATCERVDSIVVERIQDARRRRLPFQKKIGAGLSEEEFRRRAERLEIRHVGLTESVAMIAASLGWELERITDEIEPKIATQPVESEWISVAAGQVCGLVQVGTGYLQGEPVVRLQFEAYLGAPDSYDAVHVEGSPSLHSKIAGGIHGDVATASIAVNMLPRAVAAEGGLYTMRDLPIPSWWSGS